MKRLRDDVTIEHLNRIGEEYLPGFLGLIVLGPILGHASWHAYRDAVIDETRDPDGNARG